MRRWFMAALLLLPTLAQAQPPEITQVLKAAHAQVGVTRHYDGSYVRLDYPGGDVPADRGVCTDVVIRAYRAAGLDLQLAVNEDMRRNFAAYPQLWGLSRPDRNIDHRRVPNLETWARRAGHALPVTTDPAAYRPGDLVSWRLPNGLPHIGVVSDRRTFDGSNRPLIVHNIGAGARVEDVLFAWPPVGHFRIFRDPEPAASPPGRASQ
ncbi:DUF1287 domain-containing protein [Arenimonas daejeonensis]|uniref:DUF1287 domain-containing protein n=1 Tax=Arenimonas daejeonensis TaxID=370777 RepID=UPI001D1499C5|nr:DUF1287 domain-containing protein [Arenimonas daejeonensis]